MSPVRLRAALAQPAARAVQHPVLAALAVALLARLVFVVSSAGQGVGAFAPAVGTAFRRRGHVAWAVAVLAVAGGAELARWWRAAPGRRSAACG